jgi:formate hydrogenlyase subunit 3/multisubunit Na+/H+ antiporter MnhD subunit
MNAWWQEMWALLQSPDGMLLRPIVIAGLAGLVAYVCARRFVPIARLVSLLACAAVFALGIRLFTGPAVAIDLEFLRFDDFRLAVAMSNHTFGALIAMGVGFFGVLISLYAQASERGTADEGRFHAFVCWTLAGGVGAAMADDLIWLLICWEVVSLSLYMLLNFGRGESAAGAAKTFAMIGFGDGAMLLAIALIGATQGTFRIDALSIPVHTPLTYICYVLFLVAALAKAGAVPMHSWIPAAASDASAAVFALLPASIDKLLGIYLLALFSLRVFVLDEAMRIVLMVVGAVTILAAVLMAIVQHHLKKLLSFHAVSQVGYMVLGIGTGVPIGIAGGVFHMINHAIYKSCLFLTAGAVERRAGTSEMNRLGGLARALPTTFVCCAIAALAISGVPPLNGFASKWLVYQGCLADGTPLAMLCLVAAVFGSALTLASFVKVLASAFWGPRVTREAGRPEGRGAALLRGIPMVVLAALCIAFGIVAQWPLQHLVLPAIADAGVAAPVLTSTGASIDVAGQGLWAPAPATMLILLGILGGLLLYGIGRASTVRVSRTFAGGEVFADEGVLKVPATSFYRTVEELPGVGGALQDGSRGAFDVYRLGGRYGDTLVQLLRERHTGVLSLYVSWCLVGAVLITLYLLLVLSGSG